MKKNIFIAIILGFSFFVSQGYCWEVSKSQYTDRFAFRKYTKRCYDDWGKDNCIRFMRLPLYPVNWKNELEIDKLVKDEVKKTGYCDVQREWRWDRLIENRPGVLALIWHNLKTGESGWCAVKNQSDHFYVSSDYYPWTTQRDFTQKQSMTSDAGTPMRFQWIINGKPLNIWFRNPNNENGWTKHNIQYQFGGLTFIYP
jgi:hypothetical protein